ncbi:MAG TPA: FAD-dependent oxidoreductase [Syntrophorhabdales bacterium]|nr:FAD-dependent oxidoreductase [Syntrophorhabdales bacterium]
MYDVAIVGAGPAGLTAAVYSARKKLSVLLISKDVGGQTLWTNEIENYMGYQFIEGAELIEKFERQVRQFPIDVKIEEEVVGLERVEGGFGLQTAGAGSYQAKTVIIASGKRPRSLGVPGEERLRGRGVTYCSTCDGPLFEGMKVAVIGGGNSAVEAVIDMLKIAEHVYMISLTPLTCDQILHERVKEGTNVTVFTEHETQEVLGDSSVSGIRIKDLKTGEERTLEVQGVFVEIGLIPNSDLARDLLGLNKVREIEVNCSGETGVPGLFAAGDVTDVPEKQIVVAAGEGAKAALQAYRYLQKFG